MAQAVSVSNQGRQLVCSICQKRFEEMTISSCFHTFCLDCLRGQVSSFGGTTYRCPICKASVNLPGELIRNLRSENYEADDKFYSSSVNMTCDICSDGRIAINRCMQCEESLCHTCTNAHLKMKASRYHRQHVVPLADDSAISDFEKSRSQKNCWRHWNEEIQFVCKKCGVLLCLICKLLEHEHHVTKPISEEANDVRRRLASLLQKQVSLGEKLQMNMKEVETRRMQYPLQLEQQLTKLNYQASQIHKKIENEKVKSEQELKLHYDDHLSHYEADQVHLQKDYEAYRSANSEALHLLDSKNDVYVVGKGMMLYDRLNEIEDKIVKTKDTELVKPSKHFQNGVIDSQQLQRMFGHVSENGSQSFVRQQSSHHVQAPANRDDRSPEIMPHRKDSSAGSISRRVRRTPHSPAVEIEPLSDFVIPFNDGIGYVYGIAPVDNSKAWITLLDHASVYLVNTNGNVLSSVDVGDLCEDVAANTDGSCYVTCPRTKSIKHVYQDGSIELVSSQLPQDPHGIAFIQWTNTHGDDQRNELYVCLTATRGSTLSLYDKQKGCVRVFSEDGEDVGKVFLTQSPVRVDVHYDNATICVSDHSNGCVTVSDLTGQVIKTIYTGETEQELFKPLGVCFDSRGNVIVAEWSGNRVSLISQEGAYLMTLVENTDGPQTVAYRNGLLWVGSKHGAVNIYKMN